MSASPPAPPSKRQREDSPPVGAAAAASQDVEESDDEGDIGSFTSPSLPLSSSARASRLPWTDLVTSFRQTGPMPVPEGDDEDGPSLSETQKKKKKRKGASRRPSFHLELDVKLTSPSPLLCCPLTVLAHEKLFLDHLPSADRYYKSFMHRDVVNTITVTKSVQLLLLPFLHHVRFASFPPSQLVAMLIQALPLLQN